MNDAIGVEVGECQGYVMAQIHFSVVREWCLGIRSDSHPLAPLGVLAVSNQDLDRCPSTG